MKQKIVFIILAIITSFIAHSQVGNKVPVVTLTDVNNASVALPYLGEKLFVLFYVDPDVQEIIDPLSEALDAKKYPTNKFGAIGVINCKDTWIPNAAILAKARQKQDRFPKSLVLLDEDYALPNTWNLGKCNGIAKIIVVGKDKNIKYLETVKSGEECKNCISAVIRTVESDI